MTSLGNNFLYFFFWIRIALFLLVERLVENELVLDNPALEVKKLTVSMFVCQQKHQSALEVEQNGICNHVREAWLNLVRVRFI